MHEHVDEVDRQHCVGRHRAALWQVHDIAGLFHGDHPPCGCAREIVAGVVGVVGDGREDGLDDGFVAFVHVPHEVRDGPARTRSRGVQVRIGNSGHIVSDQRQGRRVES